MTAATHRRATRPALTLVLALAGLVLLAACGKKAPPRPPEGEENSYTYPLFYPAPRSVVPSQTPPEARLAPESDDEETGYEFPYARTKTKVIHSE